MKDKPSSVLRYAVRSLELSLTTASPQTRSIFPLIVLLILFSASGMCALIYEVVWYQLLQLAIGSTSVSLGILLATFMGGLCIGSIWFPRIRFQAHPLKIYAGLELGIAVCAVLVQIQPALFESLVHRRSRALSMQGMLWRGFWPLCACCRRRS